MNATPKQIIFLSATNKNAVILSLPAEAGEATQRLRPGWFCEKDPSFFSLSTAAIFRTRFSAPPQRFPFSASPSSVPPQWRPLLAFSPPFSVPPCLRGKSLFAGAYQ